MKLIIKEVSDNDNEDFHIKSTVLNKTFWASKQQIIDAFGEAEFYKAYSVYLQDRIWGLRSDFEHSRKKIKIIKIEE